MCRTCLHLQHRRLCVSVCACGFGVREGGGGDLGGGGGRLMGQKT